MEDDRQEFESMYDYTLILLAEQNQINLLEKDNIVKLCNTRNLMDKLCAQLTSAGMDVNNLLTEMLAADDIDNSKLQAIELAIRTDKYCILDSKVESLLNLKYKILNKENPDLSKEEANKALLPYLLLLKAFLQGNDAFAYLSKLAHEGDCKEFIFYDSKLRGGLSFSDLLYYYWKNNDAVNYLTANVRAKYIAQIQRYFKNNSDDVLAEKIVKDLASEILGKYNTSFESLLDWSRGVITLYRENGIELNDLTICNYALGTMKEVLTYAKTD